jgi:hypothetical protein
VGGGRHVAEIADRSNGIGSPRRTRAGGLGPDGTPAAGVRSPYGAGFDDP